ncbi:MAG: methyl-accepting chemotaxis protein [Rhizobacter sp.]|nr:methyl-accepting chemotaxis protein [Rhizobacter sp.]
MKSLTALVRTAAVSLAFAALAAHAMTSTPATRDDAKALAEQAAAHVKKVGFDQALKDFNTDASTWGLTTRDKLVYIYVYDYQGKVLAHAANPAVVGKDLLAVKDPDGKTPVADSVKKAQEGGGFVEFKWSSPATKKIARGAAYIIPVEGKNAYIGGHAFLE